MSSVSHKNGQTPEGGWGWVVTLGMSAMFIVTMGPMASFGLIFGPYLTDLGEGTKSVTVITSILFSSYFLSGLLTNYSLKQYSCRQVGVFGGVLFVLGNFLTIFATSVPHLIISFAIVPGIGMGLMSPASFACFNTYFLRRRKVVMSVAQVIMGAGAASYPLVVQTLIEGYGFRGTQALLTAISMHAILAMAVLRPVDNVEKTEGGKVKELNGISMSVTKETKETLFEDEDVEKIPFIKRSSILEDSTNPIALETENIDMKAVDGQQKPQDAASPYTVDGGRSDGSHASGEGNYQVSRFLAYVPEVRSQPRPSVTSVKSWMLPGPVGFPAKSDCDDEDHAKKRNNFKQAVVALLDLTLLKDSVFVNIVLGLSFIFFADMLFFLLLPIIVNSMGFTQSESAICLAVGFAGDLTGRVFLVGMAFLFPTVPSRKYVFFGAVFSVVFRTVFVQVQMTSFFTVLTLSVVLGFFRGWIIAPIVLVLAEHCTPERFPSAFGLYMVINGVIAILLGPVVGYIRDVTGSYPVCVHSLSAMTMVAIVLWMAEGAAVQCKPSLPRPEQRR